MIDNLILPDDYEYDYTQSIAQNLADLPEELRMQFLSEMDEDVLAVLEYDGGFWLRPNQKIEDGDWHITAITSGRGYGKTYANSHWVKKKALENPGCRLGIAARSHADLFTTIVNGESGIMSVHAPSERPTLNQLHKTLTWPNGSSALLLSAESPDQARGPQFHFATADEFAAWKVPAAGTGELSLWENLVLATRLGDNPQLLITTTPKRTSSMKKLYKDAEEPENRIRIVTGSTFENKTLSDTYMKTMLNSYGNSELARQELYGEQLSENSGIVFTDQMIEQAMVKENEVIPYLPIKFVAVDPTVADVPTDETGIIVFGMTGETDVTKRKIYVLADRSVKGSPDVWARQVIATAKDFRAKHIIYEKNQGGALIENVLSTLDEDKSLKYIPVHASTGKKTRAEPVVVQFSRGAIKLTAEFPELFDQMVFWDPETSRFSPDRMDAFVWGVYVSLINPDPRLRMPRSKATSAANRSLPSGIGYGRMRATGSIRRRM